MIQSIADYIKDKAPAFLVAIFLMCVGAYVDFKIWQNDVNTQLDWRSEQVEWNAKMESHVESTDSRVTFLLLEGGHITPADLIKDVEDEED